jgi:hypothetical protein
MTQTTIEKINKLIEEAFNSGKYYRRTDRLANKKLKDSVAGGEKLIKKFPKPVRPLVKGPIRNTARTVGEVKDTYTRWASAMRHDDKHL